MKKIIILMILMILFFVPTTLSIGNPYDWTDWGGPLRPIGGCYDESEQSFSSSYITNSSPSHQEENVVITAKGVQTCIDIVIDTNCSANITFEWINYSLYFDAWLEWAEGQNWYDWESINWSTEPTYEDDSFWFNYYEEFNVNTSQTICMWNDNVSCYTENNWETTYFDWRVTANFTCGNATYNTTCYYWFEPEPCPISYIYPPSPNGTICPCCDAMCVTISN